MFKSFAENAWAKTYTMAGQSQMFHARQSV